MPWLDATGSRSRAFGPGCLHRTFADVASRIVTDGDPQSTEPESLSTCGSPQVKSGTHDALCDTVAPLVVCPWASSVSWTCVPLKVSTLEPTKPRKVTSGCCQTTLPPWARSRALIPDVELY